MPTRSNTPGNSPRKAEKETLERYNYHMATLPQFKGRSAPSTRNSSPVRFASQPVKSTDLDDVAASAAPKAKK